MGNRALFLVPLVLLAVLVRGGALVAWHERLWADPDSYAEVAQALVERGEFAVRDTDGNWRRTAYRPPLYPGLLAALGGPQSPQFARRLAMMHLVLGLATVAATAWLGQRWQLPAWQAALAALFVAIDPILLRQSAEVMTETMATLLALAALLALPTQRAELTPRRAVLSGFALGLCLLCRPTFAPFALLVGLGWLWLAARRDATRSAPVVFVLAVAVVLAPWMVRNAVVFGKPLATTSHGGQTLLRGNNPGYYHHLRTRPWGSVWSADAFDLQLKDMRELPAENAQQLELAQDRWAYQQAWQAMRNEPTMCAYASALRLSRLFGAVPAQVDLQESSRQRTLRYVVGVFYLCTLSLAVLGAGSLRRKLFQLPWLWGTLMMASITTIHALYWTDMRMRAPLIPVLALLAANAAGFLCRNCLGRQGLQSSKPPCSA